MAVHIKVTEKGKDWEGIAQGQITLKGEFQDQGDDVRQEYTVNTN
jgi:hypothetical protein